MAEKLIPDKLREIADDYGCNLISYLTTTQDGDIFSLSLIDSNGEYAPIGLPILYSVNGSIIKHIEEDRATEILSNLKE